ncbi:ABC transporter permease subunit [bacterium]|nr:ABC transporter permease subunit [candidate division CSSED10-310 bacterium]
MNGFMPVFKREMREYFNSPIAYVVITLFLLLCGVTFWIMCASYAKFSMQAMNNPYMAQQLNLTEMIFGAVFNTISVFMLLFMPVLTMRSFSEEKRSGTIELLFTYPISDWQAILGKFSAALSVFVIMLLCTGLYPLLTAWIATPEIGPILSGYLGVLLMGASFLALGILASSLTENQIVAAVLALGSYLLLWFVGWGAQLTDPGTGDLLKALSVIDHFDPFVEGVIELQHVAYYVLFTFFCLFLTSRVLESKKWRG